MDTSAASLSGAFASAAMAETHISVLFFVGDRAYKLKKPVRFPFADFTTRGARETACHREVELNRRLAPDVYLGVAEIIGSDGAPCDHLVVMRRMPDDRRLAKLVQTGATEVPGALDDIARQLASFHAVAERSPTVDRAASTGAISALWQENFAELHTFTDTVIDTGAVLRAERLANDFIAGRGALFLERIAGGYVCDGHGDLQADDVFCLPDGPRILDCIEFCDEFRFSDKASDVAFLAMDLERLGAPELGRRFVAAYEEASSEAIPPALVDFYIAYRAQVRAKVACIRADQQPSGSPERDATVESARGLLALCVHHLEAACIRLVIIGGLPGTGKTTVAKDVAEKLGATLLRSDVIRKELMGLDPTLPAEADYRRGLYATDITNEVYDEMFERSARQLKTGCSVVLDASFADDRHRGLARQLGADTASEVTELRCVLDVAEAGARILGRRGSERDASDATPQVAAAMAATFAVWPEATELSTAEAPTAVTERAVTAVYTPSLTDLNEEIAL
jgi:aminoglycoside phosphotransferase family enzyme/predicted kinase